MADQRVKVMGGGCLGGLIGAFLGVIIGGFIGSAAHGKSSQSAEIRTEEGNVYEQGAGIALGLGEFAVDACGAFFGLLFGAGIGGIVGGIGGSVLGAGLATKATRTQARPVGPNPDVSGARISPGGPQLVGATCVLCQKRIDSVVEGEFCSACGSAVHHLCVQTQNEVQKAAGCSRCGSDRTVSRASLPNTPIS